MRGRYSPQIWMFNMENYIALLGVCLQIVTRVSTMNGLARLMESARGNPKAETAVIALIKQKKDDARIFERIGWACLCVYLLTLIKEIVIGG